MTLRLNDVGTTAPPAKAYRHAAVHVINYKSSVTTRQFGVARTHALTFLGVIGNTGKNLTISGALIWLAPDNV